MFLFVLLIYQRWICVLYHLLHAIANQFNNKLYFAAPGLVCMCSEIYSAVRTACACFLGPGPWQLVIGNYSNWYLPAVEKFLCVG